MAYNKTLVLTATYDGEVAYDKIKGPLSKYLSDNRYCYSNTESDNRFTYEVVLNGNIEDELLESIYDVEGYEDHIVLKKYFVDEDGVMQGDGETIYPDFVETNEQINEEFGFLNEKQPNNTSHAINAIDNLWDDGDDYEETDAEMNFNNGDTNQHQVTEDNYPLNNSYEDSQDYQSNYSQYEDDDLNELIPSADSIIHNLNPYFEDLPVARSPFAVLLENVQTSKIEDMYYRLGHNFDKEALVHSINSFRHRLDLHSIREVQNYLSYKEIEKGLKDEVNSQVETIRNSYTERMNEWLDEQIVILTQQYREANPDYTEETVQQLLVQRKPEIDSAESDTIFAKSKAEQAVIREFARNNSDSDLEYIIDFINSKARTEEKLRQGIEILNQDYENQLNGSKPVPHVEHQEVAETSQPTFQQTEEVIESTPVIEPNANTNVEEINVSEMSDEELVRRFMEQEGILNPDDFNQDSSITEEAPIEEIFENADEVTLNEPNKPDMGDTQPHDLSELNLEAAAQAIQEDVSQIEQSNEKNDEHAVDGFAELSEGQDLSEDSQRLAQNIGEDESSYDDLFAKNSDEPNDDEVSFEDDDTPLEELVENEDNETEKPKTSKKGDKKPMSKLMKGLIGLAAVVVVGGGAFAYGTMSMDSNKSNNDTQQTENKAKKQKEFLERAAKVGIEVGKKIRIQTSDGTLKDVTIMEINDDFSLTYKVNPDDENEKAQTLNSTSVQKYIAAMEKQ